MNIRELQNLNLSQAEFNDILKWAKHWQPELAEIIQNIGIRYNADILLSKDKIPEQFASALYFNFMDAEINSDTSEECSYFSKLVELWRPMAGDTN